MEKRTKKRKRRYKGGDKKEAEYEGKGRERKIRKKNEGNKG